MGTGASKNFVEDSNKPVPIVAESEVNVKLPKMDNEQSPIKVGPVVQPQTPLMESSLSNAAASAPSTPAANKALSTQSSSMSMSTRGGSPSGKEGRYEGERNEAGEKHGQGKLTYANGDTYVGEWKNNKKDGKGTYLYKNGDCYTGNTCEQHSL